MKLHVHSLDHALCVNNRHENFVNMNGMRDEKKYQKTKKTNGTIPEVNVKIRTRRLSVQMDNNKGPKEARV